MSTLVIRRHQLLLIAHVHVLSTDSHRNPVQCKLEIASRCNLSVVLDRVQNSQVHHILNVGATKAACLPRQIFRLNVRRVVLHSAQIIVENLLSPLHVWQGHVDGLVESSRPLERWIEYLLEVGRADHDNAFGLFKAVHLGENLI